MRTMRLYGLVLTAACASVQAQEVLWRVTVPHATPGHRPSVAPDGTIYWDGAPVMAISPAGEVLWESTLGAGRPIGLDADGSLYASDAFSIVKLAPDGSLLWSFVEIGQSQGIIGGPTVGPDGNVYVCADFGLGVFSLTPSGGLRWNVPGFGNNAGLPTSEMVFGSGHVYKAERIAPTGDLRQGLVAIELDGDVAWAEPISGVARQPRVSPLTQNVHVGYTLSPTVLTYTPAGDLAWSAVASFDASSTSGPAVGPDGRVYAVNNFNQVYAFDENGEVVWSTEPVASGFATPPEISPDNSLIVFGTSGCFGGACPGRVLGLSTADGSVAFDLEMPVEPEGMPSALGQARFAPDGSAVYMTFWFTQGGSALYAIDLDGGCGADLDGDGDVDGDDFFDYLDAFAGGNQAVCDLDGDGDCDADDFFDYLDQFAGGC